MRDFPSAAHTYFRVINADHEKRPFIDGHIATPNFRYKPVSLNCLKELLNTANDERIRKNLELVQASLRLRRNPDTARLEAYRRANLALYTAPDRDDLLYIIQLARQKATPATADLLSYIDGRINTIAINRAFSEPSAALFELLRGYIKKYLSSHDIEADTLYESLQKALIATGLDSLGWRIEKEAGHHYARTIHAKKLIIIGELYRPRTTKAIKQIVLHEVYGHALRHQPADSTESEGFATLLEQLIDGRFTTKRSYRFVAAALGWGVVGRPRDFREVYEVIWRLMVLRGRYQESAAKSHAYDECVRVFRGGVPGIAGAVYLKDTTYFMGNCQVWEIFIKKPPTYDEFVDILEGRKRIL